MIGETLKYNESLDWSKIKTVIIRGYGAKEMQEYYYNDPKMKEKGKYIMEINDNCRLREINIHPDHTFWIEK